MPANSMSRTPTRSIGTAQFDKLHAEAFRDLEGRISDCQCMAKIAAQLMSNATTMDSELVFAVFNTSQILKALIADYQAA